MSMAEGLQFVADAALCEYALWTRSIETNDKEADLHRISCAYMAHLYLDVLEWTRAHEAAHA